MVIKAMDDRAKQYAVVAKAISYIRTHAQHQPDLKQIAEKIGLSEFHLQRTFTEWAGVSPKRFLQYLTKEHAKQALRESEDILSTALSVGLSGPSRLHDLMITWEAMTPGEIKQAGAGVALHFGHALTPFGNALFAWTTRGLAHLEFCDASEMGMAQEKLKKIWPKATLIKNGSEANRLSSRIFDAVTPSQPLHLILRGSPFQLKIWEALLQSKPSQLLSYSQLASLAEASNTQRAVGTALAANPLAYLIPCHRVIRQDGEVGNYRWGTERKLALLGWEAAHTERTIS